MPLLSNHKNLLYSVDDSCNRSSSKHTNSFILGYLYTRMITKNMIELDTKKFPKKFYQKIITHIVITSSPQLLNNMINMTLLSKCLISYYLIDHVSQKSVILNMKSYEGILLNYNYL